MCPIHIDYISAMLYSFLSYRSFVPALAPVPQGQGFQSGQGNDYTQPIQTQYGQNVTQQSAGQVPVQPGYQVPMANPGNQAPVQGHNGPSMPTPGSFVQPPSTYPQQGITGLQTQPSTLTLGGLSQEQQAQYTQPGVYSLNVQSIPTQMRPSQTQQPVVPYHGSYAQQGSNSGPQYQTPSSAGNHTSLPLSNNSTQGICA